MKKSKYYFIVLKKGMLYSIVLIFMLLLCLCCEKTLPSAKDALFLCGETIIPSLFPFFILSGVLIKTGFAKHIGRILSPLMKPLFNVSGAGGFAFIIGIACGYPTGAKAVCDLQKSGSISYSEAKTLLPFCNNSGPLFVIGAVGTGMLKNHSAGIFLYMIHIISAIITGIVMGLLSKKDSLRQNKPISRVSSLDFGEAFLQSVKDAINSILLVCGFVIFFAAISTPVVDLLPQGNTLSILARGILEVTGGAKYASFIPDEKFKLCLISGLLGFGGISVMLQVMGIVKETNIGIKTYFFGKIFQGCTAFLLCYIILKKTQTVSVFAPQDAINFETGNIGATITSVFIICVFYFSVLALRKNFKHIE